jgi:general stress protein CsbA
MINNIINLASYYGFDYTQTGTALQKLADVGLFSYGLPFLLIFALLYGIISALKIFKDNNAISGIISLSAALMALQFDFVPRFFEQIFPRLGIGLVVILIVIILLGFFGPLESWMNYVYLAIGGVVLITILITTSNQLGYYGEFGWWLKENWLLLVILLIGTILIATMLNKKDNSKDTKDSPFLKLVKS